MQKLAFIDSSDGYYECSSDANGFAPAWTENLTPCAVAVPVQETLEQIIAAKQAALEAMIQQRLDAFAQSVNFDNIASACLTGMQPAGTYRQAEGAEFITLRYTTWQKAAEIRDAVFADERPMPTWEEVEAELPTYPIAD